MESIWTAGPPTPSLISLIKSYSHIWKKRSNNMVTWTTFSIRKWSVSFQTILPFISFSFGIFYARKWNQYRKERNYKSHLENFRVPKNLNPRLQKMALIVNDARFDSFLDSLFWTIWKEFWFPSSFVPFFFLFCSKDYIYIYIYDII